jgi:hypothetical protein
VRYFVRCCLSDDVVSSRLYVFAHNNLRIILTVKHGLVIHYVRLFVSGCVHVRIGPICVPSDVTEIAARYGCISERSRHRSADQTSQPDCRHEHPSPQRLWPSTHQGDNKCVPANPAKLGRLSKLHHHRIDSPYLCGCQRVRKHSTGTARAQPVHTNPPKHANCRLSNVIWIPVAGGRQCVCRAIIRSRGDATPKHLASVETTASGRPSAPTSVPVIATNCCL